MSIMDYMEASATFKTARYPHRGKPLQNNTRLYERWSGEDEPPDYSIELHSTYVVTIHPDDTYTINTGGWDTHTTWNRIYGWSPLNWSRMEYINGEKNVMLQPRENDPRPDYPQRTIPKPFHAEDPGPAPVKSPDDCIAGELYGQSNRRKTLKDPRQLRAQYEEDGPDATLAPDQHIRPEFKRTQHVLAWIDTVLEGSWSSVWVDTWVTEYLEYGEERYRQEWHPNYKPPQVPGAKYEQCPHCAEFDKAMEHWRYAMEGRAWPRNDPYKGYETFCEMMERYDSREGWRDAWREEGKEVSKARVEYRAWVGRNYIPYFDGIRLTREGYPINSSELRKEAIMLFKEREREKERAKQERLEKDWDEKVLPFIQAERPRVYKASGEPIAVIFPRRDPAYVPSLVLVKRRCSHKAKEEILLRASENGNRIDLVETVVLRDAVRYVQT